MSIPLWLRTPRIRRGLALSAVVLATGGLVLYRAPAQAHSSAISFTAPGPLATGKNTSSFSGPGAHGQLSLSHSMVLAGRESQVFAEIRVVADAASLSRERAPISLAVVLDTSGSMTGEKIDEAKRSVLRLIADMRDDDEIALIRYSDSPEVLQPLARLSDVRERLVSRISEVQAGGGTQIPSALSSGRSALAYARPGRVKRIVLVSDGLDSTRAEAEALSRRSFESGITVSSLGIGLDFDEGYMGSVAQAGHGNFGFVKDGAALASFLKRELVETAATTIENASVRVKLPRGVRFMHVDGADATLHGDEVELKLGSLFAGDERRVVAELATSLDVGETRGIVASASWTRVGAGVAEVQIPQLELVATRDLHEVEQGRDGTVIASWTSVAASRRQVEAAEAYSRGDQARAQALIEDNLRDLKNAAASAPAPAATALERQMADYEQTKQGFAMATPESAAGKTSAKAAAAKQMGNFGRSAY